MRLQIISDIHLEFLNENKKNKFINRLIETSNLENYLAVLGDISPNANTRKIFFEKIKPFWKKIFFVPGNHDYWNEWNGMQYSDEINSKMANDVGIILMQMNEFVIDDIVILGATLWSDQSFECKTLINDYEKIKKIEFQDIKNLHLQHKNWFENKIKMYKNKKIICLSHHVPSYSVCQEKDLNDPISSAYYSNCDSLVEKVFLWAHGHTHHAKHDGKIVCNPIGYPSEKTNYNLSYIIDC